jgi:hypothetical protein
MIGSWTGSISLRRWMSVRPPMAISAGLRGSIERATKELRRCKRGRSFGIKLALLNYTRSLRAVPCG